MRKIKMSGSTFRKVLFDEAGVEQTECAIYTGLNNSTVSQLLRSRQAKTRNFEKQKLLIYNFYKDKAQNAVSYKDFWCITKTFKEVK